MRFVLSVLAAMAAALLLVTWLGWADVRDAGPDRVAPDVPPPAAPPTAATALPTEEPTGEPTGEPTDAAFDEQPGAAIARAGSSAMGSLTSVRYRISVSGAPDGRTFGVDVRADDTGDCTGTIAIDDGVIRIRGVGGEQWFKADEAAWRAAEPGQADDFIAAAGGHWVRDEGFEFANFCFFAQVLGGLLQDVGSGTWFAVGSDRVDGHDVVRVQGSSDGGVVVATVRVDEPHYLAAFERTDDSDGAVSTTRFSEFGDDVEVDAPAGDDVVDLSALL